MSCTPPTLPPGKRIYFIVMQVTRNNFSVMHSTYPYTREEEIRHSHASKQGSWCHALHIPLQLRGRDTSQSCRKTSRDHDVMHSVARHLWEEQESCKTSEDPVDQDLEAEKIRRTGRLQGKLKIERTDLAVGLARFRFTIRLVSWTVDYYKELS